MRFIPTAVGNMSADNSGISHLTVHPHGCGEHACTCNRLPGSVHPHGCGEHSSRSNRSDVLAAVHPHGCGEHHQPHPEVTTAGSSPRLWGTSTANAKIVARSRFIPTGVGNIRMLETIVLNIVGSSPRLWGTCAI